MSLRVCTWSLLSGAGDNPLHKAAFHQRLFGDAGFLPLGPICLCSWTGVFTVGIRHKTAIHHLLISLKTKSKIYKLQRIVKLITDIKPSSSSEVNIAPVSP